MRSDARSRLADQLLDPLDKLVAELLDALEARPRAPASELVRERFRDADLRPRQQKRVKELFHRAIAESALLDHALRVTTPAGAIAPQLATPVRVLLTRVLMGDLSPRAAASRIDWIDWPRVAHLRAEVDTIEDPIERLALRGSLPTWLCQKLHAQYGEQSDALVAALVGRPPTVLRANTLRCTREQLAERLAAEQIETHPTERARHGLEVLTPAQLFRTSAFHDGWFEMQDEASQLVAEVVAPPPGGLVIDACAGAGGKALALAALLQNRGTVIGLDVDAPRLQDLRLRGRRAGTSNLRANKVPAEGPWPDEILELIRRADRVLIDAPCSGIGSLRRHPDMRRRFEPGEFARLHAIQTELIDRLAPLLKPRARLIYATCTVLAEENEAVIDAARARHPDLEPVSIVEILGGERGRAIADPTGMHLCSLPHVHGSDGFFAAVLRRPRHAD